MKRGGRPLRFLLLVAGGWIGVRAALLWPQVHSLPDAIRLAVPFAAAAPSPAVLVVPTLKPAPPPRVMRIVSSAFREFVPMPRRASNPMRVQLALLNLIQFGAPEYTDSPPPRGGTAQVPAGPHARASRWSGSAWLVARPGRGLGAAPGGGQLGGSQAGVRIGYALDPAHGLGLYARFAAPLEGRGREAAFGVEWQPTRIPARLIAEQRIGMDGQRGGPALGVVGGWEGGVPAGFTLESYGQAGAVARDRVEPFADGAARATRPVANQGAFRLGLGLGAWGAAQRDAARLDVGPSATLALRLPGQQVRLALDWRQRVAGEARPGSGLALTIGSDF